MKSPGVLLIIYKWFIIYKKTSKQTWFCDIFNARIFFYGHTSMFCLLEINLYLLSLTSYSGFHTAYVQQLVLKLDFIILLLIYLG